VNFSNFFFIINLNSNKIRLKEKELIYKFYCDDDDDDEFCLVK